MSGDTGSLTFFSVKTPIVNLMLGSRIRARHYPHYHRSRMVCHLAGRGFLSDHFVLLLSSGKRHFSVPNVQRVQREILLQNIP